MPDLQAPVSTFEAVAAVTMLSVGALWWEGVFSSDVGVRDEVPSPTVKRDEVPSPTVKRDEVPSPTVKRDEVLALEPSRWAVRRARDFDPIVLAAARRHGVSADLVRAVIHAESGFRSDAVSPVGARGLMQLMPATAEAMGVSDVHDPRQNIDGGTRYLRILSDRFGDDVLVIAAYNAGPGNVRKFGGVPPFRETVDYVRKVRGLREGLRRARASR